MKRLPLNINDNRASLALQSGKEVRHTIDSSYQRWQKVSWSDVLEEILGLRFMSESLRTSLYTQWIFGIHFFT